MFRVGSKVTGYYYSSPFAGRILEMDNIRWNHENGFIKFKIEVEEAVAASPGCVKREIIYPTLKDEVFKDEWCSLDLPKGKE